METLKCIETRRSIRKFADKPVDRELIEKIVAAAQMAPTWKNTQTARFAAITSREGIDRIRSLLDSENSKLGAWNSSILSTCTVLMAVSAVKHKSGHDSRGEPSTAYGDGYTFFDCGAAVQSFCLAAHDLGVGTVILGHFDIYKVSELSAIADDEELVVLIACGYPAEAPEMRKRLETKEVLRFLD